MPDFNSPLGRRQLAMSAQQQRVLTVPDEEAQEPPPQYQPQQQRSINPVAKNVELAKEEIDRLEAARQNSRATQKRITPLARERMELLLNIGRLQDEVEVDGIKFSIQSLKAGETKEIVKVAASSTTTIESYFLSRQYTLAYALFAIDGQSLSSVLGSDSFDDVLRWLDNMDENVVEYLHTRYLNMVKKNKDKFSLNTPEEAKEVAEDVKKS